MAQLIDKDALVAEIEKLVDKGKYNEEYDCAYRDGTNAVLHVLKNRLNTLEVKEVDLVKEVNLEKEIDEVIHNYKLNNHRHTSICSADIEWISKYFFDLRVKAHKGE